MESDFQVEDDDELNDIDYYEFSTVLFLIGICSKIELQHNAERVCDNYELSTVFFYSSECFQKPRQKCIHILVFFSRYLCMIGYDNYEFSTVPFQFKEDIILLQMTEDLNK